MPDDTADGDGSPSRSSVSRVDDRALDRIERDLDRALADKMLARADDGRSIARDLDAEIQLALPPVGDIDRLVNEDGAAAAETNKAIQELFAVDTSDHFAKALRLDELLRSDGVSLEQRAVVKRGLSFLKRGRYPEALEWWGLHRTSDRPKDRGNCLLLALTALTYRLAGDLEASERLLAEARRAGL